jgi:antitoxin (DNA-binding transcriptional repressor) of toxin-antitoxin stability system
MKTINEQQAVQQFGEYSERAHNGERILVTRGGKPWVLLSPPAVPVKTEPANGKLEWPDFAARLAPHYSELVAGPTATELLAQDKEDRF